MPRWFTQIRKKIREIRRTKPKNVHVIPSIKEIYQLPINLKEACRHGMNAEEPHPSGRVISRFRTFEKEGFLIERTITSPKRKKLRIETSLYDKEGKLVQVNVSVNGEDKKLHLIIFKVKKRKLIPYIHQQL